MPTKIELSDRLNRVLDDLEASESAVEKQILERERLLEKYRGQTHSITDLKDRNKKLQSKADKLTDQGEYDDKQIREYQTLTNSLRKEYANQQNQIIEASAAVELGLQLFYPDSFVEPIQVKEPKARLLLRVFDILSKNED